MALSEKVFGSYMNLGSIDTCSVEIRAGGETGPYASISIYETMFDTRATGFFDLGELEDLEKTIKSAIFVLRAEVRQHQKDSK